MATRSLTALPSLRGLLTCKAAKIHHSLGTTSCRVLQSQSHLNCSFHSSSGHLRHTQLLPYAGRIGEHGIQSRNCLLPPSVGVFPCMMQSPLSWCIMRGYAKKSKIKKEKVVKGGKKVVSLSAEELDGVLDLPKMQAEMCTVAEDLKQQMIQQVSIRTNIGVYDSLRVKTEDGVFPLMQLGQIVQKNPSLILVNMAASPQYIKEVKDALSDSGLNVNPQQDGTTIFISVPKVTREYREGLAKNAKMIHDKAKLRLRDIHNKYVKKVRAAKDHHSEDIIRAAQDLVLDEMHSYGQQLDTMLAAKQQELLGGK